MFPSTRSNPDTHRDFKADRIWKTVEKEGQNPESPAEHDKVRRSAQSSGLVMALASRSKVFEGSRHGLRKGCPRTKTAWTCLKKHSFREHMLFASQHHVSLANTHHTTIKQPVKPVCRALKRLGIVENHSS